MEKNYSKELLTARTAVVASLLGLMYKLYADRLRTSRLIAMKERQLSSYFATLKQEKYAAEAVKGIEFTEQQKQGLCVIFGEKAAGIIESAKVNGSEATKNAIAILKKEIAGMSKDQRARKKYMGQLVLLLRSYKEPLLPAPKKKHGIGVEIGKRRRGK